MELLTVFLLLILFQVKHFVADYPLQTRYMLGKFNDTGWVLPLTAHCSVHAVMTAVIAIFFVSPLAALILAILDFSLHFAMDRIKASPKMLGRFTNTDPRFWWSLGFDQMFHHLTHYMIIYLIMILI